MEPCKGCGKQNSENSEVRSYKLYPHHIISGGLRKPHIISQIPPRIATTGRVHRVQEWLTSRQKSWCYYFTVSHYLSLIWEPWFSSLTPCKQSSREVNQPTFQVTKKRLNKCHNFLFWFIDLETLTETTGWHVSSVTTSRWLGLGMICSGPTTAGTVLTKSTGGCYQGDVSPCTNNNKVI